MIGSWHRDRTAEAMRSSGIETPFVVSWHNPLHCKLAAPLVRPDGTIISKQRGKPQDPFSVYAALEHNGDYAAATAAVKAMKGYVPPEAVRNSSKARAQRISRSLALCRGANC